MKIGLSYSRCIADIYDGNVNPEDVLVIISRTDFDPLNDEQWNSIWMGYTDPFQNPAWSAYADIEGAEESFRKITVELYKSGKLHQPRQFGARPVRRPEYWLEAVLPDIELKNNPAAKKAWDQFQTIAGLSNIGVDKEYQ